MFPLEWSREFFSGLIRDKSIVSKRIFWKKKIGNKGVCVQNLDVSHGIHRKIYGLRFESCLMEKYS